MKFLLVLIFLIFSTSSFGVTITQKTEDLKLSDDLKIHLTSDKLEIEDVVKLNPGEFSKYASGKSLGFTQKVLWGKVPIKNRSGIEDWFVSLYVSHIGSFRLYKVQGKNIELVEHVGRDIDARTRAVNLKYPTIPVAISKDFDGYFYIRAESENNLTIDLDLRRINSLITHMHKDVIFQGIYYGFLIGLMLYVLSLWIFASESLYGRYGLYLFAMALLQLAVTHEGSTYLWPGKITFDKTLETFSGGLIFVTMGNFLREFFKDYLQKMPSAIPTNAIKAGGIVCLISILSSNYVLNIVGTIILVACFFPAVTWFLFKAWRSGIKPALFMWIGWGAMSLGMYYQIVMKSGFFSLPYIYNFFQVTCIIDFILFTASISLRIRDINIELAEKKSSLQLSKGLSAISAGIAHEAKKPLQAVSNVLDELLEISDTSNAYLKRLLDSSRNKLNHSGAIFDDILKIGKPDMKFQELEIRRLIEDAINLSKISYTPKLEIEDFSLKCDKEKTIRAFTILIDNAFEHGAKDGEPVLIRTCAKNKKTLEVINYGVYLEKDEIRTIFEPWVTKGGNGLGLYLFSSIVKSHNWENRCHSSKKDNFVAMILTFN